MPNDEPFLDDHNCEDISSNGSSDKDIYSTDEDTTNIVNEEFNDDIDD